MAEKGATPDLEQPSKQNVDECHNKDEACCQIDPLTSQQVCHDTRDEKLVSSLSSKEI
jgi:hypothetical protein